MCVLGGLAAFMALCLNETLEPERRKPMDWSRANPLSFFRMLRTSRTMFCWMLTSQLQTFIDGRNITESNFVYMQQELGFDEKGLSNCAHAFNSPSQLRSCTYALPLPALPCPAEDLLYSGLTTICTQTNRSRASRSSWAGFWASL
jgi:hypothetical protein